jgi:hypothetical protein
MRIRYIVARPRLGKQSVAGEQVSQLAKAFVAGLPSETHCAPWATLQPRYTIALKVYTVVRARRPKKHQMRFTLADMP